MGGSTTTNTTGSSQSINEIPQWVQNAGQQNYALAQQVASQPLTQYQGQMVAGVSPQMQQALNLAGNSGSVGVPAQSAAQAGLMTAANYQPNQIGAPSQSTLAGYMNPYTTEVINKTLPIMQQNLALSQDQQQNAASAANAYGGSRQAIQQGVTQAQGAMGMGQMAAQLNQAGFQQAMQNAQQAAMANQTAGLTANQQQIAASQGLGTLGSQQVQNNLAQFGMLTGAGGLEEQQQQNDINAQIAKFQQAWQYPQQQLGMMESSLGMTPYNTGTSGSSASTTEQQTSNPAAIAGGAFGMLGSLFGGPAAGAGGLLMGSDRRLKTDIKRIDTHPTGVPIFSYRYKGDPKSYPKVTGPMAEDVAKIAPHAVRPMGIKGRLAVHMPTLDALGTRSMPRLNTPPSSPGVGRAIGMLAPSSTPGRLSPFATPPTRSMMPRARAPRIPIMGALGG